MTTALALTDDGLTIEFDADGDCADLTSDEAEAVTVRIRRWVNDFPIEDVLLAFRGRVWIALAYDSWAEWCECELGGLKLPAPKRREVVAGLASEGMSNTAIAEALDVSKPTVARDLSGVTNVTPDRLGRDGKTYTSPEPKSTAPEPDPVIDAEIVCRDCDGYGCETCFPADVTDDVIETLANGDRELADGLRSALASEPVVPQQQKPRETPITKTFSSANFELRKAVERVVRLSENDRFKKNKDQISGCHLSDLIRARDAINGVIQQLEG